MNRHHASCNKSVFNSLLHGFSQKCTCPNDWLPVVLAKEYPGVGRDRLGLEGLGTHAEFSLAKNWHGHFSLDVILGRPATIQDHEVAATIIQWIGNPSGLNFLAQSLSESKTAADHLIRTINSFKAKNALGV